MHFWTQICEKTQTHFSSRFLHVTTTKVWRAQSVYRHKVCISGCSHCSNSPSHARAFGRPRVRLLRSLAGQERCDVARLRHVAEQRHTSLCRTNHKKKYIWAYCRTLVHTICEQGTILLSSAISSLLLLASLGCWNEQFCSLAALGLSSTQTVQSQSIYFLLLIVYHGKSI